MKHSLPAVAWPAVALLALLTFNMIATPGFALLEIKDGHLYGSMVDIFNRSAPVALLALGMTLVIATGGVDLSVGAVMAIAGAMAAVFFHQGGSVGVAVAAGLCVAGLGGLLNGALVDFGGLQPIVATLVLMVAGRGVAQLLTDGQILSISNSSFVYLGAGFLFGLPFPVILVCLAALGFGLLTRGTALGLFVEATGENDRAARLAGISISGIRLTVYLLCGLCAGLAGLVAAADIRAADANTAGLWLELDAILAVAIGGTSLTGGRFSLVGSLMGAWIIQTLSTMILSRGVAVQLTLVVKALVILAVCLLQSEAFRRALRRRTA